MCAKWTRDSCRCSRSWKCWPEVLEKGCLVQNNREKLIYVSLELCRVTLGVLRMPGVT